VDTPTEWCCAPIFDRVEPEPFTPNPNDYAILVIVVTPHRVALPEGRTIEPIVACKDSIHIVVAPKRYSAGKNEHEVERGR
jgi:hypothetical protein